MVFIYNKYRIYYIIQIYIYIILINNIHNFKGTWKLIKNIINKSYDKNNYVCKNNDSSFSIVNKFNDIFVICYFYLVESFHPIQELR